MSIAYSALDLRKTLRDWNKKIGSEKTFNDKHLAISAPFLLDPFLSSSYEKIGKLLVFAIPLILFLTSCFLILYALVYLNPYNSDIIKLFPAYGLWLYLGLYTLCAFYLTYKFSIIVLKVYYYNKNK